ncbi:hypothetical protein MTP99_005568 [Tenebrio molitor]|jgi:hypothetical protein|nr:hypothetical protein MTP99_005568 [Tenebrio molitor]
MTPKKPGNGREHQKHRKRNKGPIHQYTQEQLSRALHEIKVNGMPKSKASKQFGIPRTTLRDKVSAKTSENIERVGKKCTLGKEIENKLVEWIVTNAANGFPVNKDGLMYSVQKIVERSHIQTPFTKNKPGRKWFDSFLRRNPIVRQKHAEYINKARASISEEKIRTWFSEVRILLKDDIEVLNHPQRIWNMDETAVFLSPKGGLVLAERGKPTYDITSTSEKDNVTTLITVNALGESAPPLTIFKYDRLPRAVIDAAPPHWGIGKSDSGWMQSENFYEYFANVFHPFLVKSNIQRPVVMFLDGHGSHLSLALSAFCRENQIILVCLPANATHIMQPLDVAFFYPLKQKWKTFTRKWMYDHDGFTITKKDVPGALNTIMQEEKFQDSIISGFRTTGLYPFDEDGVNYSKCVSRKSVDHTSNKIDDRLEMSQKETALLQLIETRVKETTVLDLFKRTYESKNSWEGDMSYLELYKLWKSVKDSVHSTEQNAVPDNSSILTSTNLDQFVDTEVTNINFDEDGISFPFLEWNDAMEYQECVVSERDDSNIECFDGDKITVTAQVHQVEQRSAINDAKENRNTRGDNEISIVLQEQEEKTELEILKTSEFQENDNLKDMSERENSNIGCCDVNKIPVTAQVHQVEKRSAIDDAKENRNTRGDNEISVVLQEQEEKTELEILKTNKFGSELCVRHEENDLDAITVVSDETQMGTKKKINILQNIVLEDGKMKENNEMNEGKTTIRFSDSGENVNAVLQDVLLYPNPKPNKKRRKVDNLPSVLTSDQWVHIAEAKEKDRQRKEEVKKEKQRIREENRTKKLEKQTKKKTKEIVMKTKEAPKSTNNAKKNIRTAIKIGSFVIVRYDDLLYPAEVVQTGKERAKCRAMEKSGAHWKWPQKPDVIWYGIKDILEVISAPTLINTRGVFFVDMIQ